VPSIRFQVLYEDDIERQIALVVRAIDADCAGLVIAPNSYLALVGPVREALSKHIPTVVIRALLPIPPGRGRSYTCGVPNSPQ
jgi:ABC-type sugar transport system substrate-binding protein